MTAELVEGRCHTPLDSGIRRNDGILILITGFGFDEACLSCLQAVEHPNPLDLAPHLQSEDKD
jgi:hypothetical protein